MRIPTKKVAAIAAGAVVLSTAGVAYAYWTTSGSGTGSASTTAGTPNVTVSQTAAPSNLAPGVNAGGITVTVKNNADNNAYVTQVVASIASVTKADGAPAGTCAAGDYTLSNATMTNGAGDLAKDATATFSGATLGFNNKTTNQDACKGATVNLSYAVS